VTDLTIRPAGPEDAGALDLLAALDSSRVPAGPLLLAEVDGALWAAVAVHGGRAIADPFRPSGLLVELLRARARASSSASPRGGGGAGCRGRGRAATPRRRCSAARSRS
jgi:hypothetical protein